MGKRSKTMAASCVLSVTFVTLVAVLRMAGVETSRQARAQPPKKPDYVGITKCAACHFPQYKEWKLSDHGKAFEILPAKYRKDAECLTCHATGAGSSSRSAASGVSCEACHGPGGEHSRYALRFVNEEITEEGLLMLRSKIKRIDADQCVNCHVTKAHKPHPKFDRAERPRARQSRNVVRPSRNLFDFSNVHARGSNS